MKLMRYFTWLVFIFSPLLLSFVGADARALSAELPTYHQIMMLSPHDRREYLMELRKILVEISEISSRQSLGLIVEDGVDYGSGESVYAAIIDLVRATLPEANADIPKVGDTRQITVRGGTATQYCEYVSHNVCTRWGYEAPGGGAKSDSPSSDRQPVANGGAPYVIGDSATSMARGHEVTQYCMHVSKGACTRWGYENPYRSPEEKAAADQKIADQKAAADKAEADKAAADKAAADKAAADKAEADKAEADRVAAAQKPRPQDAATLECDESKQGDSIKTFRSTKELKTCIYAGNMSTYKDDNQRKANGCKRSNNSYCLDSSKANACPPNLTLKCKDPKQVVCNPLVFGSVDATEAICVKPDASATKNCDTAAANSTYDSLGQLNAPISEEWNDFAKKFKDVCGNDISKNAHCSECKIIFRRLTDLNGKFKDKLIKGGTILNDTTTGK